MSDRNNDYSALTKSIEDLGGAFEEFKQNNDDLLEKKANREAFGELEAKVEKINEDVGKFEKHRREIETRWEAERARIESLEQTLATGGTIGSKKLLQEHRDAFYMFWKSGGRGSTGAKLEEAERRYLAALPESKQINLGSAAAGEALVPEIIHNMIETMEQKISPVRRLIPVLPVTSTDFKQVVDIRGTASGWLAETGTRTVTGTPSLRTRTPTWGELYARPQASDWSVMDIPNAEEWISTSVAEEFVKAEGLAVISGDGSNKPTGFLDGTAVTTADDASPLRDADVLQYVAAPSPDSLTDHITTLVYTLQSGYRPGAAFVMNSNTLAQVRRAKASDGHYLWEPNLQTGQPPTILGYRFEVWEDMPDTGQSPLSFPIAFGNWSRGYLLAQRSAIRMLFDPYTTIGLVSWWFRRREGGIILNNDAIKLAQR